MILLNKQRWLIFLLLSSILVTLYALRAGHGFPLDDSWIHQSYGRNLGLQGEWSLISGQPSAASTAPFYTVLLAFGYAMRVPYMFWTHMLGTLALWGIGVFGAMLVDRILPGQKYAGLLTGIFLIITWQLVWAAASGMETALFSMWTLLLPLMVWRETDEFSNRHTPQVMLRGVLFGAMAALAMLTRPEGVAIAGLCGLALWVIYPHDLKHLLLWTVGALIGFVVLVSPYLWLNYQLIGGFLPNTSAAKQAQHEPLLALSYPYRLWMMTQPLLIGGQVLLIPGLVAYLWQVIMRIRTDRKAVLLLIFPLWMMLMIAVYAARLPAAYQHGRYMMPLHPALVLMGTVGVVWILEHGRRRLISRVLGRTLAIAALLSFAIMVFVVGSGVFSRDVAVINEEMVATAKWIDDNIAPDDFMAIHDVGAVAYFAPRPMLDIAGLVSPEVVSIVNDADALWDLIQAYDTKYLMAFPDQIPGDDPDDPRLCEVFITNGQTSKTVFNGPSMAVYALAWDGFCGD